MKQKYFYLGFIIFLLGCFTAVYAQTIEVRSFDDFSTANPPSSISIELLEPLSLSEDKILDIGTKVDGELFDVVSPKRLKRDAGFSFKPKLYYDEDGKTHIIYNNITASYTEPIDKGKVAKSAVLGVGNFFVKGIKTGVTVVEGAVKNEQGNRLKSAGVSLYESSPVSYVEKGEEIEIKKEESFFLKFRSNKSKKNTQPQKKE